MMFKLCKEDMTCSCRHSTRNIVQKQFLKKK